MTQELCPHCRKGFLIEASKGIKRCNVCGYIKHSTVRKEKEIRKKIPRKKRKKKYSIPQDIGYQSAEYQARKMEYDQQIRASRRQKSIEKILKELRKRKYDRPKTLIIEGETYNVETGRPVWEEEQEEFKKKAKETIEEEIFKGRKKEKEEDEIKSLSK